MRSDTQQTVEIEQASGQTIYVIQPAKPQVVYVPQYDPTVVYVRPSGPTMAASLITFGAGLAIRCLAGGPALGMGRMGMELDIPARL